MSGAEDTSLSPAHPVAADEPAARPGAPPRRRLFHKYAALLIALVGGALLITSAFDFWFSYQENKAALIGIQQEKAQAAAQRIAEFVVEIERQIGWTTHAQWAAEPLDQRRQDYFRLLRQVPAITELSELDGQGKEQLKVSRLTMDVVGSGLDLSHSRAFTEAKAQRSWFSPVFFRKQSEPYMTMAVTRDGRDAGVTVAEINLKLIWNVITALKIGEGGYAYVVDGRGRLIADPDISLVLRDTDLSRLPQVAAALTPTPGAAPAAAVGAAAGVARNLAGNSVLTAHAAIGQLGWLVFVEVPLREAFAPLYGAALRTALLLVFGLVVAALVALWLARRLTGPIRAIAAGAERIGQGDLDRRIDIRTGDELEALAEQFNGMGADLQKSYAELEQRVADRTAELSEALDQQTATAEVLGVINSSPGDLAPVFDAMLEKALRLCSAALGYLYTCDGERFLPVAAHGDPGFSEWLFRRGAVSTVPGSPLDRITRGESFVQITDATEAETYRMDSGSGNRTEVSDTRTQLAVAQTGARTAIWVALRKDAAPLGAFVIYRQELRPFSDKQIALLENFAAQAVIAMENARLITETREALEQQTATAEVLQVINSSPGDLAPVFDAMLEKARTLCQASFGVLWTYDGELAHASAVHGVPAAAEEFFTQGPHAVGTGNGLALLLRGDPLVHIRDVAATEVYRSGDPLRRALVELCAARTVLGVPLRKDSAFLGAFFIYRLEVRPFTDKEIALLQNFAAQAVIAMENARLIIETREALDQQTATAEVLQVINSSPGDLAPVFGAILEKANYLCETAFGVLWTFDGTQYFPRAVHGPQAFIDAIKDKPRPPGSGGTLHRHAAGEKVVHIDDMAAETGVYGINSSRRVFVDLGRGRSALSVALRKDGALFGALQVYRQEVRPFSDKQIALLQNFAAQAVIAMENARLITETREALDQQTATAEVLQVINASPGDLAPVFDAMLERAMRLCEATYGHLYTYDGERFWPASIRGERRYVEWALQTGPVRPSPSAPLGRISRGERIVHIADIREEDAYRTVPSFRENADTRGSRSQITIGLFKDNVLLGAMIVYRQEVRPFSDKQIALLQNFAAQAVIAMENARLITETREALDQQTATAEVLQVINASPGDLAPVFDAMLDKAMRLCGAALGTLFTYDGELFHAMAYQGEPAYGDYLRRGSLRPERAVTFQRILRGAEIVHIVDVLEDEAYRGGEPVSRAAVEISGMRTLISVPLRKDGRLLGSLAVYRQEVRPFSDKQIALLQNFAAQAVIAMENARLITETREALEQQTATAEVLQVINCSPGDLAPVFDAILEKGMSLCQAAFGILLTYDGERFHHGALHSIPAAYAEFMREHPPIYGPGTAPGQLAAGERLVHVVDMTDTESYRSGDSNRRAIADLAGARTLVAVPLRKDDALLGAIVVFRQEVRPFTDKQIALLQNFAAQAVIAMENARLITETREALEQQTATAEILQVINSSPGDLAPVFDAILEKAHSLCDSGHGSLFLRDGNYFRPAAMRGVPERVAERLRGGIFGPEIPVSRPLLAGEPFVHLVDLARIDHPMIRVAIETGVHVLLSIPLRKGDELFGMIVAARFEPRPFTDKQIALLQNFAAQAVIAMENARLLTETRERTRDLQESLEYQTATSDVLKVISQSTFDLTPVLDFVCATAVRLCGVQWGNIWRLDGGVYRWESGYGVEGPYRQLQMEAQIAPGRETLVGRVALTRDVVHILDGMLDPDYEAKEDLRLVGCHTMLGVPLLREGAVIGVICMGKTSIEAVTDKQIELVRTFADQAVIAIENARLLNELRERTDELARSVEELKVLGEVGQAVSSTLDLHSVLVTILNRSMTLADADAGVIFRYSRAERAFRFVEAVGWDEALVDQVRDLNIGESVTALGDAIANRAPFQIPDLERRPSNPLRDLNLAAGFRSVLIVPLVGADRIMGATILQRRTVGEFPEATIRLMQALASQSVLAIQNARLFREIAEKSEQLAEASRHKSQFLANMSHELRTPLNAILGYTELMADGIYGELAPRAAGVLERVQNNGKHLLALINDVLDLAKIEAGQLSLTLEDYALPDVVQSVVSATEGLANTKGLKFTANIMSGLPTGHGDARRLSQVLLNLVGNAVKFTDAGEVAIAAAAEDGHFVLTVRDTGPGIAPVDHAKIFEEFQQVDSSNTRKKGGTGLGLAISRRMVEMQGGTISVDSELGHGATFRVRLPIRVEDAAEELMGAA